jgi:hypothetical protein
MPLIVAPAFQVLGAVGCGEISEVKQAVASTALLAARGAAFRHRRPRTGPDFQDERGSAVACLVDDCRTRVRGRDGE